MKQRVPLVTKNELWWCQIVSRNSKSAGTRGDVQNFSGCQAPSAPVLIQTLLVKGLYLKPRLCQISISEYVGNKVNTKIYFSYKAYCLPNLLIACKSILSHLPWNKAICNNLFSNRALIHIQKFVMTTKNSYCTNNQVLFEFTLLCISKIGC